MKNSKENKETDFRQQIKYHLIKMKNHNKVEKKNQLMLKNDLLK